ncbi:MAG: tryptophan 7-halogenase [Planctomycetes bacterium]|nr:tryptophan 7-halogenase [Planctomycetota bacterium]
MADAAELRCDAVVIGGGPAGAAAAARLRRRGHTVVVLESERFPRFHIGESLLPLGHDVFDAIGCRERVEAAGFHQKRGAQLRSPCGEHRILFDFAAQGVRPSTTIQVHRAAFDQLLLDHAASLGAEVVVARAKDLEFASDGVAVVGEAEGGGCCVVRARVAIDASGRAGFVARHVGVRVPDRELVKASIYAHFRNVRRDPGEREGDTRIVSLPNLGWVWLIPLSHDVTSVGVVLDIADYKQREKGDLGAIFDDALRAAPLLVELMADAERVTDFGAESGFSYRAERYAGERWLLAGDAGSFLDPVWSTGVQMALMSGVEAADAAVDGWLAPAPRPARAIARFDRTLQQRYAFVRRFVTGFYDEATRDLFFAPRPYLGIHRAVTRVLAGGFELGWLDRLRLQLFFLLGRLQAKYDLVPRRVHDTPHGESAAPAMGES